MITDGKNRFAANREQFNDIMRGIWVGRAMAAAAALGLADAVGEEPVQVAAFAAQLKLDAASLHRLLRGLSANGIFEQVDAQSFRHNDLSRQLRSDHPFSLRPMALFLGSELHNHAWDGFVDAIRDGKSGFSHRRNETLYEHLRKDASDAAMFNQAMVSYSLYPATAIAKAYSGFQRARSVLDVGGGLGALITAIVKTHPEVRGGVFELPHLAAGAARCFAEAGVSDRVAFYGGDFLEGLPGGFDIYMVKNVLWNWNDESCVRILSNIRRALGDSKDRRLLIMETIILPSNKALAVALDLQMLAITAGGQSGSDDEYRELARLAGFCTEAVFNIEDTVVMECSPS